MGGRLQSFYSRRVAVRDAREDVREARVPASVSGLGGGGVGGGKVGGGRGHGEGGLGCRQC